METSNNRELSLKLYVVLHHAFHAIQSEAFKDMRKHGLNPTAFAVLELLYNKGPQQVQHIGEKVLISSSSITYVVTNLEKEDYVRKEQYEADRRVSYVSLTGRGKSLMDKIFPDHAERLEQVAGGLDPKEKSELIELLKKLGKNVSL
ncbi:MarR family transcriptional regulator [Salinicoccus sp. ID82-1]|uniref:MarR family winged helix-turn-helix transcriptional regulator n=1 Tax=Salinicoccus sp. ID82-1 TaxID=2820269 RepID=UPI001F350EB0|nr:MarR family transcriptional regulator [Salinicoccus sp. ID82-1]MCG1010338.1 MarR family transcriptional regulator [Salinicoccus sp. ID82-1]